MSTIFERLRATLPNLIFGPPATDEQIARIERELGTPFPQWLRELYLKCNGIRTPPPVNAYLRPLERTDDGGEGLLGWNIFHRDQWTNGLAELKENRPGIDWDHYDPRRLLIIGGHNTVDWAIDPMGGPEIIWYDVRNPNDWEVIAADLAEACVRDRDQNREIVEQLFRGRRLVRRERDLPPSNDVELLLDTLIELCRGTKAIPMSAREATSPSWSLYRATSQRPGEGGMLFVLEHAREIQIATRDGNLPFILRARFSTEKSPAICLVKIPADAMLCILHAVDYRPDGHPPSTGTGEAALEHTWRHRYGPPDPELEQIAAALFARDDRRLAEENKSWSA